MGQFDFDKEERGWLAIFAVCFVLGLIYILDVIPLPYLGSLDQPSEWTVGIFWTIITGIFFVALLLKCCGIVRCQIDPFFGLIAVLLSPFFLPGVVYLFGGLQLPVIGTPSSIFEWLIGIIWTIFWGLWVGVGLLAGLGLIRRTLDENRSENLPTTTQDEGRPLEDEA